MTLPQHKETNMNKIITRCFQRGGAFSNACRRLAKSALTAFALIAATFTANAADVISINFVHNTDGVVVDETTYTTLAGDIPGSAWNTVFESDGEDIVMLYLLDRSEGSIVFKHDGVALLEDSEWREALYFLSEHLELVRVSHYLPREGLLELLAELV